MEGQLLIEGLKNADNRTMKYIYDEVVPSTIGFLRKDIKDDHVIDDLIADGMQILLLNARENKITHLDNGIGPYFWGIANRLRLKYFNKQKSGFTITSVENYDDKSQKQDIDSFNDEINTEQFKERLEEVMQALDNLKDEGCKDKIIARYKFGVDSHELALEYNLSNDAFRQRLSRCMKALRKLLDK